jgi:tRNA(Ile)-lysidine synthase
MIEAGDHILAGVSGGADSVCLCLVLRELSTQLDFSLEVIHVEHGIRGEESRADARFVRELCGQLAIPCREAAVDVPAYAAAEHIGLEEAARALRYRVFAKAAEEVPGAKIALAHHMEDNAETILLQMIRGSGLDGLCGMAPVRRGEAGEWYLRPLLAESRSAIEAFLAERGQPFCEDSTNADLSYARNRIRKKVLPELVAINPQALRHINRTGERMRELRDYMEEETDGCLGRALQDGGDAKRLSVEALTELPRALRLRLIHRAVGEAAGAKKDITTAHLEEIEQLLWKQSGRQVDLPGGIVAKRVYGEIVLMAARSKERCPADGQPVNLEVQTGQFLGGEAVTLALVQGEFCCRVFPFNGNFAKIPRKMYTKWFDYDKIKDSFSIRTRSAGDYFVLDDEGHRKKLADYFVDEKIPADKRDQYLLMTQGAKVLWIVGGRMGYDAGVTKDTRRVLEMTYREPK